MKRILIVCLQVLGLAVDTAKADFGGELTIFTTTYLNQDKKVGEYIELRLRPELFFNISESLVFFAQGDFRLDSKKYAGGFIDSEVEEDGRWSINVSEAYLEGSNEIIQIRAGKLIFDWSVTDTVSPLDNINPRDWTDVVEYEKVGVPALDLIIGTDTFFEVVYVPWFTPSKIPSHNNPWMKVNISEQEYNNNDGQWALRVGSTIEDFDVTLSYYNGYSFSPLFRLNPTYQKEEVFAGGIVKELSGLILRAEIGMFYQNGADDFSQYVIGAEYEWNELFRSVDSFHVLVQYTDETVLKEKSHLPFPAIDFRRVFSNAFLGRLIYGFDDEDRWTALLEGTYNTSDHDFYIEPSLRFRAGRLDLIVGAGFMSGPDDSFWGGYDKNDRLFSKIILKF